MQRIVRLKQAHRITSIADFISARYGKSEAVAALVTGILMVGIVPYVGLQLKALSSTFALRITPPGGDPSSAVAWFSPLSVVMMTVFTIMFGIRHLDPTERHPGMVISLAAESIVKIVAFLAAGVFIVGWAFGSLGGFLDHFATAPEEVPMMGVATGNQVLVWITVGLLSMSAFAFLPRQFHVGVVEAADPEHVQSARWMTPLYLFAINLFVVPIAMAGKHLAIDGIGGDQLVLALPLQAGQGALSLAVFVGGFSAAIGMIMIESMAMSTMISNHLLMPLVTRFEALAFLRSRVLYARWVAAAGFIGAGYAFEVGIGGSYMLVAIGLISFASAFLLMPVVLAGLYWREASRGGALLGLSAGFVMWFYTLLMPTFVKSGWMPDTILSQGPFGLGLLRPEALLGFEGLPSLSHGVMWSAGVTVVGFVVGTVLLPADREERQLTDQFLDLEHDDLADLDSSEATIDAGEKRQAVAALLGQVYPEDEVHHLVARCFETIGCADKEMLTVVDYAELYNETERTLSGALGAASAHGMMKASWGTIDRKDAKALAREYARMMAKMKLSPKEIKQRIDFQAERESLLTEQFAALQKHNDELEDKVRERTREIQTILDNVTFGFCVVDRTLTLREGFTASCDELFAEEVETGASLSRLLHIEDRNREMMLELGVDEIYEDLMPEELLLDLLPDRFEQPDGRVLHLDASVIRDEAGAVDVLLLTVSDITDLEAAQQQSARNQVLIGLLQQKAAFGAFLQDTKQLLAAARSALAEGDRVVLRRVVHTIKGNSAIYGLMDIVQLIHGLEEEEHITSEAVDTMEGAFRDFLTAHGEVLELDFDDLSTDMLQVSPELVSVLRGLLGRGDTGLDAYRSWATDVLQQPASKVLGPLEDFVEGLAERLGKEVDLVLRGQDIKVEPQTVRPVFQNLTHLIRNSMDHGIEAPEDRGDKPARATITVVVEDDATSWRLRVSDDGRGIDTDKVVAKSIESGMFSVEEAAALSHDEKLGLIFLDGLSSAEAVTDVSGRGVGMSAVKATVEDLGGELLIESTLGQGTTFTQVIPKPVLILGLGKELDARPAPRQQRQKAAGEEVG